MYKCISPITVKRWRTWNDYMLPPLISLFLLPALTAQPLMVNSKVRFQTRNVCVMYKSCLCWGHWVNVRKNYSHSMILQCGLILTLQNIETELCYHSLLSTYLDCMHKYTQIFLQFRNYPPLGIFNLILTLAHNFFKKIHLKKHKATTCYSCMSYIRLCESFWH